MIQGVALAGLCAFLLLPSPVVAADLPIGRSFQKKTGARPAVVANPATKLAIESSTQPQILDQPPDTGVVQKHLACVSNYGGICKNTNAFFVCRGSTVAEMAKTVCTIHTETGVQFFPSEGKSISSVGGGKCGQSVIEIMCRNMPADSKVEWHFDNCQGQKQHICQFPRGRYFDCGVTPDQIAKSYCTKDGVTGPYQIFKFLEKNGHQCGYAAFAVGCHVPAS